MHSQSTAHHNIKFVVKTDIPWMEYFGFAYRDIKKGFPLSLFDTKGQAEEAINKESALLAKEKEIYLADLKILEGTGLLAKHPSLKEALQRDTNPLCLINHIEFSIHPIDAGAFAETEE